jgi:hypothetical protein
MRYPVTITASTTVKLVWLKASVIWVSIRDPV